MSDSARTPVIVGVGQLNDRPADPMAGLDTLGLMAAAARLAEADAGGGAWLAGIDSVGVVDNLSFRELGDVVPLLVAELGASPRIAYKTKYPSGASPILLLNEAAHRIANGEITTALIAGGEALRTAAQRAALQAGDKASDHNAIRSIPQRREPTYAQRYGLIAPVDIYPLYENATRAAWGQSLAQAQAESGEIWSRFSQVAAAHDGAWIRKPVSADDVVRVTPDNRPIAFPYNKLMVANSSVNQGAAFIVTSLAQALQRGLPEERLIYVGHGAAADESNDILARDRFDHSASMAVSLQRTLDLNAVKSAELDCVELYSCFPCVPKMARRIIDWPVEKPASVFGGLTFGGGPIGNYMSHAVVAMAQRLRTGGRHGLLFANGGFATQNHSIIISRDPARAAVKAQDFHHQAEADAQRAPIPSLIASYSGPAKVETYTVFYERDGRPRAGVVVGKTPAGERFLAKIPATDENAIAYLTDGKAEPIGASGFAFASGNETHWRF